MPLDLLPDDIKNPDGSTDKNGLPDWLLIAVIVGLILLLFIIILIVILKRKHAEYDDDYDYDDEYDDDDDYYDDEYW